MVRPDFEATLPMAGPAEDPFRDQSAPGQVPPGQSPQGGQHRPSPQVILRRRLLVAGIAVALIVALISAVQSAGRAGADRAYSLSTGATGLRVTALQYLLVNAGHDVSITGKFANQTESSVSSFQQAQGLDVSGVADRATITELTPVTETGAVGLQVKALQTLLGMHEQPVPVDGTFSPATRDALLAFQKVEDLEETGLADAETWAELFVGPSEGETISESDQFLDAIAPHAREARERYGVPASVAIAQASQETGWGHAAPGNNYFGVKCHGTPTGTGPIEYGCQELNTGEWEGGEKIETSDKFRTYASMRDSTLDYAYFLHSNSRYGPAFLHSDNPHEFARAIQEAGYATDPTYADSLIQIIKDRNLYRYDA